jgi:diacylglycerol kinase
MNGHDADDRAAQRAWSRRLRFALRGLFLAVTRESNFVVYLLACAAAAALAAYLGVSLERWALVALCGTIVIVAEMFNTAIEHLARAVTLERRPEIRDALDLASGAVLASGIGAAVAGLIVLAGPLVASLR